MPEAKHALPFYPLQTAWFRGRIKQSGAVSNILGTVAIVFTVLNLIPSFSNFQNSKNSREILNNVSLSLSHSFSLSHPNEPLIRWMKKTNQRALHQRRGRVILRHHTSPTYPISKLRGVVPLSNQISATLLNSSPHLSKLPNLCPPPSAVPRSFLPTRLAPRPQLPRGGSGHSSFSSRSLLARLSWIKRGVSDLSLNHLPCGLTSSLKTLKVAVAIR